jgi:hypothetical protein
MDILGKERRAAVRADLAAAADQLTNASSAGLVAFALISLTACLALVLAATALVRTRP